MKKFISILLLFVFLYQIAGFTYSFLIRQNELRKEVKTAIKNGLPLSELDVIVVSGKESSLLSWVNEKEFFYQDQLYDVVRSCKEGDTTIYYCINDVKEKELFGDLEKHIRNHVKNKKGGKASKFNFKDFSKDFFCQYCSFIFHFKELFQSQLFTYHLNYQLASSAPASPPPDHIS